MEDFVSVTLTGPAKIAGRVHQSGDEVAVSRDVLGHLIAAGVVADADAISASELASGMPGFDEEVAAVAKVLADAAVQAAVEAACNEVIAERDAAITRASISDATIKELSIENAQLRSEIEALTKPEHTEGGEQGADEPPPAAEAAAKTPRKGAASQKG